MKRMSPDLGQVIMQRFIAQQGFINRFITAWGTTTVNGVEVMNEKLQFYPYPMADNVAKVARLLGIYDKLNNAKSKNIKKQWLYFNFKNEDVNTMADAAIISNLNLAIGKGITVDVVIGPKKIGTAKLVSPPIPPGMDANGNTVDGAALKAGIEAYFEARRSEGYMMSSDTDDAYKAIIGRSALIASNEIEYTIVKTRKASTDITVRCKHIVSDGRGFPGRYKNVKVASNTYILTLQIPQFSAATKTALITYIKDIYNKPIDSGNRYVTANVNPNDRSLQKLIRYPNPWGEEVVYEPITDHNMANWVEHKGVYYLRSDVLKGNTYKYDQKITLINTLLDTGYKSKKVPFWKSLVVFVVLIVVAVYSAGTAVGVMGQFTAAVAGASLAVAATIALSSYLGDNEMAMAGSKMQGAMEPLAIAASVIAVVDVYSAVNSKIKKAVKEAAKEGVKKTTVEVMADLAIELGKDIVKMTTGITTELSVKNTAKVMSIAMNEYQNQQRNEIKRMVKELNTMRDEETQAKEQAKTRHILIDMIRVQPNMISQDQSIYADLYDRPYEPWVGSMHTGNIQANLVSRGKISKTMI